MAELTARTQDENELSIDFITGLLVIIRKMKPISSQEMQLDMLHQNLRPELQKLVRRADFRDIEELQEIARAVEATTNGEKLS